MGKVSDESTLGVSKETVPKEKFPVEGGKYMFMSSPEFEDIRPLRKLVEELLAEGTQK